MGAEPLAELGGELSLEEHARYSRQVSLPEIGEAGQRRLRASRVAVVGAGGLGSAAIAYLAAAGVGRIGVVDHDQVEMSNLQRQVIHSSSAVGTAKTASAAAAVARINPGVEVVAHAAWLTEANAEEVLAGYDLVVDGADNFPTRYAVSDAARQLGIPHVWAAIGGFGSEVSTWWAGQGPCLRCVFPEPPPAGAVPSCADTGVLGALCGITGSIQAAEAIKLLLGIGEPLVGRILVHDSLAMSFSQVPVGRRPGCGCAEVSAREPEHPQPTAAPAGEGYIDVAGLGEALRRRRHGQGDLILIDVREPVEAEIAAIPGSILVPIDGFLRGAALPHLRSDLPVVLYCRSEDRALRAAHHLNGEGVDDVRVLRGGLLAWLAAGAEVTPR